MKGTFINNNVGSSRQEDINMIQLLLVWLLNAVSLIVVAYVIPGITVSSFGSALIAALLIGLVNVAIKPLIVLLTLPVTVVTLGLFLIVINGFLFWLVSRMMDGFSVSSVLVGILGALIYSLISGVLTSMVSTTSTVAT